MTPTEMIADLDGALAEAGLDVTLRRPSGAGAGQAYTSVTVRARITSLAATEQPAGVTQTTYQFIISPTQISAASWPGGSAPASPFDLAPSIPRPDTDEIIFAGKRCSINFVDPVFIGGTLVRINGRMTG